MAKTKVLQYNSKHPDLWYLSSFAICSIVLRVTNKKGVESFLVFNSIEAAFQYFKTTNEVFRDKISQCLIPSKARYFGGAKSGCPIRDDWHEEKKGKELRYRVMRDLQLAKFSQNLVFKRWLKATDDAVLQEYAPWEKDPYWGVDEKGNGENNHGKILMQVRDRFDSEKKIELIPDFTKYMG